MKLQKLYDYLTPLVEKYPDAEVDMVIDNVCDCQVEDGVGDVSFVKYNDGEVRIKILNEKFDDDEIGLKENEVRFSPRKSTR